MRFSYGPSDFTLDWFSGSGKGGQNRNKTQCCLRLTHKTSGIMVTAQSHRDRPSNLREATKTMLHRLMEWHRQHVSRERAMSDEVIRSYNAVDNRVVCRISGLTIEFDRLDSGFNDLIEARAKAVREPDHG